MEDRGATWHDPVIRAYYARMIMERCPDLAGFFETRKSEADVKAPE